MTPPRSTPLRSPLLARWLTITALVVAAAVPARASDSAPREPVGGPLLGSPGVVVAAPTGSAPLPAVSAKSWVIADLESGDVLAAKNPHGRFRPASAIKVLTAVTLLPRLDPEQVYQATFADANVEGSRVGIVPNGTYTVHNLFEGMFLVSGNDASRALAGAAGGLAPTVRKMNQTARSLGALDTTAKNASGLDEPGQYSSAYDLAVIGRAGMERADFRTYARTVRSRFPGKPLPGKARPSFEIYTQNKLVLNYPGALGIKTGWTTQARGTFIGAARRDGRTLIVSVMHTGQGAWREAAKLLDWGFANATGAEPVGTLNATAVEETAPVQREQSQASGAAEMPTASRDDGWWSWGWLGWLLVGLIAALLGLRTRVLIRQHARRRTRAAAARALVPREPNRPNEPEVADRSGLGRSVEPSDRERRTGRRSA